MGKKALLWHQFSSLKYSAAVLTILLMMQLSLQGAQLLHLLCAKLLTTTRHERLLLLAVAA